MAQARPIARGRRQALLALTRREVLAAAVLAGMVATGAKLAFDAAAAPSRPLVFSLNGRGFPEWLSGPFHGLGAHLTWTSFYTELLLLCALWVAAWALSDAIRVRWAVAAVVALHVLFMLGPPIGLSDAFNYIGYGRVAVEHGLNPYVDKLAQFPADPAFRYATWPDWTNPYGPLATLLFYPLGLVTVPQGLWLTKVAIAATSLGCVALVATCARELKRPVTPAVVFVGLNPVVLVYAVAGAHVDMVLIALLLVAVLAVIRGRDGAAGAALAAATATKVTGLLVMPFALAGARRRRELVVAFVAVLGAFAGVALALWGAHFLSGVADQRQISSPRSFPGILSRAFGAHDAPLAVQIVAALGFTATFVAMVRAAWRGFDWIEAAGWATVALLLAVTWLMPWYVMWLLPLAALAAATRIRYAALALTLFVVLVRLIPLG